MFVATYSQSYSRNWSTADFHVGEDLARVRHFLPQCACWDDDDLLKSINTAASKNLQAAAFFHGLNVVTSEFLSICCAAVFSKM